MTNFAVANKSLSYQETLADYKEHLLGLLEQWIADGRVTQDTSGRTFDVTGVTPIRTTAALVKWLQQQDARAATIVAETLESFVNRNVQQRLGPAKRISPRVRGRKSPRMRIAWQIPVGAKFVVAFDEPTFR